MTEDSTILLGTGRLSWRRGERIGDRYGAVMLMDGGDSTAAPERYLPFDESIAGRRGTLVAQVTETRRSTHVGDWFRGLYPSTPAEGEEIVLGAGTVFFEHHHDGAPQTVVGLRPDDGREVDWLDPAALYRAHEQTVALYFTPDQEGS